MRPLSSERFWGAALLALAIGSSSLLPSLAAADLVLVREGEVVREDLYAAGNRVVVEGLVMGDLVVAAGELRLTGRVEGDVLGMVSRAVIGGEVGGSVRLLTAEVLADGTIAEDLAILGASSLRMDGEVGRDVLVAGDLLELYGRVGRDVRGRLGTVRLGGEVGRNVELSVSGGPVCRRLPRLDHCRGTGLVVEPTARVHGDLGYRAPREAQVSGAAEVGGQVIRRHPMPPNVRMRAASRALSLLWLLAFVATGLVLLGAFPRAGHHSVEAARERPWRSGLLGVVLLLGLPAAALLLALSVVGLPLALMVLGVWAVGLFVGPVPAVAALGQWVLAGRRGRFAGFLLGSLLWWLLRAIPLVGGLVLLITLLWGLGSWWQGIGAARRPEEPPAEPTTPDWEPPLPPAPGPVEPEASPEESSGEGGAP